MQKQTTKTTNPATANSKSAKRVTASKAREAKAQAAAKPAIDKAAARAALATVIADQRETASDIFAQLSSAVSIPIKSLAAYKRTYKRHVTAHVIGRNPKPRQAAALYVALIANGAALADGATFSRKFDMRGAAYAIENGALSDCIASGLCAYDSASETVTLLNAAEISGQIKTAGFNI